MKINPTDQYFPYGEFYGIDIRTKAILDTVAALSSCYWTSFSPARDIVFAAIELVDETFKQLSDGK